MVSTYLPMRIMDLIMCKNPKLFSECYEPSSHHFYGPSLEKVRELTMKRNLDRQRQLEQIQVDRQLQNLKDLRARERFRNRFHKKNFPINFEAPPIGIGKICKCYVISKVSIIFSF